MPPRFPAAFRPPAFACWPSCPARGLRPSCDRPTTPPSARTRTGFPCSARVRPGRGGRPLYPGGGGVHATDPRSTVAACRFSTASPCHPGTTNRPGELGLTGHQQGFTGVRPTSLPLACGPSAEPAPSGFPLKLRTPASRTRKRTSGWGQVSNTDQKSRLRHHRTSTDGLTHNVRPRVAISLPIVPRLGDVRRAGGLVRYRHV